MELNREQIIKALECCTRGRGENGEIPCPDCPYEECNIVGGTSERQTKGTCGYWLKVDALSLINELTEENERLRAEISVKKKLLDKSVEVEDKVKAGTVRKMSKRIKEYFPYDADSGLYVVLDQIANEMLENADDK